ncbi:Uncharacterised protein [uncultured Clostridium sp.]|nr:Uncharacterised protein [uncultured Clostridium sp.]
MPLAEKGLTTSKRNMALAEKCVYKFRACWGVSES